MTFISENGTFKQTGSIPLPGCSCKSSLSLNWGRNKMDYCNLLTICAFINLLVSIPHAYSNYVEVSIFIHCCCKAFL